ncbi:MAG: hypothetical protein DRN20_03370 [Thermoplasmata archaeon]|nr:MAG: hypothetical protein DRN20_03370 [Thermoplasmata archaeon]
MYEVRFHGRGGQGAVLAAQALASAAFHDGYYGVAFPFFGAERRGAPVLAFARIDREKIYQKTQIYEPDCVVVLDDKLVDLVNVAEGLKQDGIAIINSSKKPDEIELEREAKVAVVDATTIALEVLGTPITNSAMLGAFAKATGIISMDALEKGIMDIFGPRIGVERAKRNIEAAKKAYESTDIGVCKGGRMFEKGKKWLPNWDELPIGLATRALKTDVGLVGIGSFVENKTGTWRTFRPVINKEKCVNCLLCWFYCPDGAIKRVSDGVEVDYDYCKGCGICANECPVKAITMVR